MKQKIKNFFLWIWQECKDWKTAALLLCVIVVMYCPVWGGYLLHAIFGWAWCSAVATAYLLFWAGPFTPFFPICIAITLSIKKAINRKSDDKTDNVIPADSKEITYQKLFWLFMAGSIAGVFIEGIFCLLTKGHWESHVVSVFGAFNILYGFGAVLLYVGAVKLRKKHILFRAVTMALATTVLELLCGLMLRYGLGMRAWSYDNSFLNYKGLICFSFSIAWGIAAFGFCKLQPYITSALCKLRGKGWKYACVALSLFMVVNLSLTSVSLIRWSERHYGVPASGELDEVLDSEAPDEWMEKQFVEWRFLDTE